MTWQVVFGANLIVALAYFGIFFTITRGLQRSGQLGRANPLGTMTAAIFFSCGVGHWLHALHLAEPWFGFAGAVGDASRESVDWHMAVWETGTAFVGIAYLSLRRSYGLLLRPQMFDDVQRMKADADLRAAEELFRSAFDAAPTGMALVGVDGRFIGANAALAGFTGVPQEELVGMEFGALTHPADRQEDLRWLARLTAGEIAEYQLEQRFRRADGRLVTALLSVSCVRGADGQIERHVRHLKDITERKDAERTAERYREQLDMAQELANVGSFSFDPETRTMTWSPGLFRLTGRHPADGALDDTAFVERHVDLPDRHRVATAFARTMATGEPFDERFLLVHPVTGLRTVQGQASRVGGDTGHAHLLGVLQDVTDRLVLQAERDAAEVRFAAVFESAPVGICLVDLQPADHGAIGRANPALAELTGRSPADLEGRALRSLVHPDDHAALEAALERLRTGVYRVQLEVRVQRADGGEAWALLTGAIVADGGPAAYAVTQLLDISERKSFEHQLQQMADHDALTGLFNRRRFDEELVKALSHAERYGSHGAVLLADLDGFKFVNDSFGHSAGDELIAQVATVLRDGLRTNDVLARIGGDEFAVLLPQADAHEAETVARKLLAAIHTDVQSAGAGRPARISVSIGVSCFPPRGDLTAEDVMAEADIAMYDAKDAGRATVRTFRAEERSRERVTASAQWITRLREALEEGRFRLLAQPIVGICANGIPRAELLLRYVGDDGELITPSTFLYLAERYDLMRQIDRWVLGEAVKILHREHAAGRDLALSVNVSGRTLTDQAIGEELAALVESAPFPSDRLIIEVTETAAITNIDRARSFADRLHEVGCRFALDDFGAGFASFYYLKHLRFDEIKIDGEFVRHLPHTPVDQLVIEAVVGIAKGLGTDTVAEFVGSDETLAILRRLGVDYGQGFHLAPPVPVDQLFPPPLRA